MHKKTLFTISILLVGLLFLICHPVQASEVNDYKKAHLAVVKIYRYVKNADGYLVTDASGSGVVISDSGIILTNNHVIATKDDFDQPVPAAYKICMTTEPTERPKCDYSADFVASDENMDIALLRIRNVLGNKYSFNYLRLGPSETLKEGGVIESLGYPSIGGETITTSIAEINGIFEKYSLSWIKTNAVVSFGSSGGAIIDGDAKLLGITTAMRSDMSASMGYAISINSLNPWIVQNQNKAYTTSSLQAKMDNLINKENILELRNDFSNSEPGFSIVKNSAWKFDVRNDNSVYIYNPALENGGYIEVAWNPQETDGSKIIDLIIKSRKLKRDIVSSQDTTFAGLSGKKTTQLLDGNDSYDYLMPIKNYIVDIFYYYGKNKVNKAEIDSMLGTFKFTEKNIDFAEKRSYENKSPYFKITLPNDYALKSFESQTHPVTGVNINNSDISFDILIRKVTEGMQSISNEDYLNFFKDDEVINMNIKERYKFDSERYFDSIDFKINSELKNEIFYKYKFTDKNDHNQVKMFAAGYRIREKDRVIIVEFDYYNSDQKKFETYLEQFRQNVLFKLTLGRSFVPEKEESVEKVEVGDKKIEIVKKQPEQVQVKKEKLVKNVGKKLSGRILLQSEMNGEAWYLSPGKGKAYFLGLPADAFQVMREQGVGISEKNYQTIKNQAPKSFAGKILLRVESKGEAYYVNPTDLKLYFLGRPSDAFKVMRKLGLGISNSNFENL